MRVVKAPRSDLAGEIEDYLLACRSRGVRPSTIRHSYGYSLRAVLLPWCQSKGITTVADIDARTLERFAAEIRDRVTRDGSPLAENTVWTYCKAANQLLKWYAAEHDTTAPKVKLRKPPGRKVDVLERDQILTLERTAATVRDRVIIRLLADTGMRPGELVSITGETFAAPGGVTTSASAARRASETSRSRRRCLPGCDPWRGARMSRSLWGCVAIVAPVSVSRSRSAQYAR